MQCLTFLTSKSSNMEVACWGARCTEILCYKPPTHVHPGPRQYLLEALPQMALVLRVTEFQNVLP